MRHKGSAPVASLFTTWSKKGFHFLSNCSLPGPGTTGFWEAQVIRANLTPKYSNVQPNSNTHGKAPAIPTVLAPHQLRSGDGPRTCPALLFMLACSATSRLPASGSKQAGSRRDKQGKRGKVCLLSYCLLASVTTQLISLWGANLWILWRSLLGLCPAFLS